MNRMVIRFAVFVLGVTFAVCLAYATRSPESVAIARTVQQAPTPVEWTQVVTDKPASAPELPDPMTVTSSHLEGIPPSARLSVIVQAAYDGSGTSLRNLDSRSLSLLPEYRVSILPALKRESLSALLSRFRSVDWTNWQLSSFARNGGPTLARSYIDTVQAVNPELGRYLETAAPLFQKLSLETSQGRVFSPERALASLLETAEQHPGNGVPANMSRSYDANILDEPGFRIFLEHLRARLIARFLDTHDVDPFLAFQLISSTHPNAGGEDLAPRMKLLLQKFALDATPSYRQQVFSALADSHYAEEIAQDQQGVRRALSELYLVGALDSIDSNDRKRASLYLDEATAIYPGLRSQELVGQLLKEGVSLKPVGKPQSPAKKDTSAEKSSSVFDLNDSRSEDSSLAQGISYLSAVIFFLVVGGALFFVFVYWRSVRALRMTPEDVVPKHKPSAVPSVRITPPGEMNFDDDILSDLGPRAVNA